MSDQESYSAWRGPVEDAEFRERLMTTRDKLTTTVTQLNAYVAELDVALRALLESDRASGKDEPLGDAELKIVRKLGENLE